MSKTRFFEKPEYCEYVRLLVRLHDSIAAGTDEGPHGEQLRERMDICSETFDDEEIESLNGISGDLYSLSDSAKEPLPRTPQAKKDLDSAMNAKKSGEYAKALSLVRRNRAMIKPSELAYFRGRILSATGLNDVAARFFGLASTIDPDNDNYKFIFLETVNRFDPAVATSRADEILASPNAKPASLLLKAAEIRFVTTDKMAHDDAANVLRELIPIIERVIVEFESGVNTTTPPPLLQMAYALCGFCFQYIDDIEEARRCFDHALRLNPNDVAMLAARGILLYGRESEIAAKDFSDAVHLGSPIVAPYLFLAHYYLVHERHDACMAMCQKSLLFPVSDKVRANCSEWIAICQTMLGCDPDTIRANFDRAIRLAPSNERIPRNLAAFEASLGESSGDQIEWERADESEVREERMSQERMTLVSKLAVGA